MREPVFSRDDVITFLLVLRWFPNSMKTHKPLRKGSCATDKEIKARTRRVDSAELLQLAFLLSEKLYLPERYVDEFLHFVGERTQASWQQANCLTVVLPSNGKDSYFPPTNFTSSQAQSQNQYQEYLYDNPSNRTDPYDRTSLRSADSTPNTLALLKRKTPRNS